MYSLTIIYDFQFYVCFSNMAASSAGLKTRVSKDYKPILVKRLSDEGDHLAYNITREGSTAKTECGKDCK